MNRFSLTNQIAYYIWFGLSYYVRQYPIPIIGGLSITDTCNLNCRHCWRKNTGKGPVPYAIIMDTMYGFYRKGVRYLYIQGGEPFTWKDEDHTLSDLVNTAKEIGFFHVAICTNGTFPLDPTPDTYWISLDGIGRTHDNIRGSNAFHALRRNINETNHPHICANITINNENAGCLEELVHFVAEESHLRGVMVNFHIPYPGVENLLLDDETRIKVAEQAINLKREGFPVLNTVSGLRAMGQNTWPRPLRLSVVSDCENEYICCRAHGQDSICTHCGYALWAELSRILRPNIFESLKLLRQVHKLRTG